MFWNVTLIGEGGGGRGGEEQRGGRRKLNNNLTQQMWKYNKETQNISEDRPL